MNSIYKIIIIAVASAFLSIILKKEHKEYSLAIVIICSVVILSLTGNLIRNAVSHISDIILKSNINKEYINLVLKIVGVSYLFEYMGAILNDVGEAAIAKKVEISGKIIIFVMTLPALSNLCEMIFSII